MENTELQFDDAPTPSAPTKSGARVKVKVLKLMVDPEHNIQNEVLKIAKERTKKRLPTQGIISEIVNRNDVVWHPGEIKEVSLKTAEKLSQKTLVGTNPLFGEIVPGLHHTAEQVERPKSAYLEIIG